jgi:lipopolysaccharide/colanic/teichoic acid biosynthesis glycosyltransferase
VKRLVDFLSAFIVLAVLSPLWILVFLLIKIFIGSPVIIKKECVGVKNRVFALRKFRVSPSEKSLDDRPFWSAEPENPWGRFLRKSKMEKIPMFFNIMKGEMSLIGPKIVDKETFKNLSSLIPFYERRFYVKPGILSFVGAYCNTPLLEREIKEKLEYDIFYVENISLFLDLKIFLLSLFSPILLPKAERSGNA